MLQNGYNRTLRLYTFFLKGIFFMNYTKKIAGLLALTFLGLTAEAPTTAYDRISAIALQAEDKVETKQLQLKEGDPLAIFSADVSVKPWSRIELQQLCLELFGKTAHKTPENTVLMPEALQELNILCGEPNALKTNVRASVDRTITTYGSVVLARMLAEPMVDVAILQKRQAFIRAVVEDNAMYDQCEKLLMDVHGAENHLLAVYSPKNPLDNEQIKKVLFGQVKFLHFINNAPKLMDAWRIVNHAQNALIETAIVGAGVYCAAHKQYQAAASCGVLAAYMAWALGKIVPAQERMSMTAQDIMIHTATTVRALKQLSSITERFNLEHGQQLRDFAQEKTISDTTRTLFELLQKNTFKGKSSFFSLQGRVVAAYKHMLAVRDEFIPSLEALGEIDALFAMARLIKEHANKNVHYCLVDFVDNKTPVLDFVGGWNPLINPEVVVAETMTFGNNGIRNMLLTGPHGSGKSSFMREAMYIALLGQTVGIAPATSCRLTPFAKLSTYLNIKEDYARNMSTFMAERKRVDQIRDIVNNLQPGEFALSIMDEVFKGTMESEGAKRVHKLGTEIAPNTQSICLMATHFNYPTILEQETKGAFVNYHVGLQEHANGHFTRLFKLVRGKNQWWFDDAVKRDAFIEWLQTVAN